MTTAIVTTSIRIPEVLASYCENLVAFGHQDAFFVVIGDRKTPQEVGEFCRQLERSSGLDVEYWNVARQEGWLSSWNTLDEDVIPYDSIQRRNLGFLFAVEAGAERIVSVDDDNWPTDGDFLGDHSIVGETMEIDALSSSSGWYNTAQLLHLDPPRRLFHRGFPTRARSIETEISETRVSGRVVVNAGLWTGVPDADAISHLDAPTTSLGLRDGFPGRAAIAPGTSAVFNTQNTAFHADLLPALFLIPMGDTVAGLTIGRHDDIWMSMFLKPIADHLGDLITVGKPVVEHVRNEHDLFEEALVELPAMRLTNRFSELLDDLDLTGPDYVACYHEIVGALESVTESSFLTLPEAEHVRRMSDRMLRWSSAAARVLELSRG